MPNFCHVCGTPTKSDAHYCSHCGADVSDATSPAASGDAAHPTHAASVDSRLSEDDPVHADSSVRSATGEYAGFWERFAAFIVDWIILFIAVFVVAFMVGVAIGIIGGAMGMGETELDAFIEQYEQAFNLLGVLVAWLYYAGMESSRHQATLGKKLLSMKVTDRNGGKVTFARATGRHFAKFISGLILFIGYIMVAFTQKKQGLHDMLADTFVVKTT